MWAGVTRMIDFATYPPTKKQPRYIVRTLWYKVSPRLTDAEPKWSRNNSLTCKNFIFRIRIIRRGLYKPRRHGEAEYREYQPFQNGQESWIDIANDAHSFHSILSYDTLSPCFGSTGLPSRTKTFCISMRHQACCRWRTPDLIRMVASFSSPVPRPIGWMANTLYLEEYWMTPVCWRYAGVKPRRWMGQHPDYRWRFWNAASCDEKGDTTVMFLWWGRCFRYAQRQSSRATRALTAKTKIIT